MNLEINTPVDCIIIYGSQQLHACTPFPCPSHALPEENMFSHHCPRMSCHCKPVKPVYGCAKLP